MREDIMEMIVETDGKDPRRLAFLAEEEEKRKARLNTFLGSPLSDKTRVENMEDNPYENNPLKTGYFAGVNERMEKTPYANAYNFNGPEYNSKEEVMAANEEIRAANEGMSNYELQLARFKQNNPDLTDEEARQINPDPIGLRGIIPGDWDLANLLSPIAKWWEGRTTEEDELKIKDQQDWDDRPKWWRERN